MSDPTFRLDLKVTHIEGTTSSAMEFEDIRLTTDELAEVLTLLAGIKYPPIIRRDFEPLRWLRQDPDDGDRWIITDRD